MSCWHGNIHVDVDKDTLVQPITQNTPPPTELLVSLFLGHWEGENPHPKTGCLSQPSRLGKSPHQSQCQSSFIDNYFACQDIQRNRKDVSHSPTVKHIKCTGTTTDKTRHVLILSKTYRYTYSSRDCFPITSASSAS